MNLLIHVLVLLSISIIFVESSWLRCCCRPDCLRFKNDLIRESAPDYPKMLQPKTPMDSKDDVGSHAIRPSSRSDSGSSVLPQRDDVDASRSIPVIQPVTPQQRLDRPLVISATNESRLRAAIAFSLKKRELSSGVLNRIAANSHHTQNDRGEQFIENGFFTVNEWKTLRFAFRCNARTETLFAIIDRYDSTIAALQGGNDGPIKRERFGKDVELSLGTSPVNEVVIYIHANGYVEDLDLEGIHDGDILDLSYLPKRLLGLGLSFGTEC